jgi:retinol dehydrogenase-12
METLLDMVRVTFFGARNDATKKGAAKFNPARDIPSLAGKVIFITGGAGGLGRQTAIELARCGKPARIYIADLPRSKESSDQVIREITREAFGDASSKAPTQFYYLDLDLASLQSVQRCALKFTVQEQKLNILILNAGIITHEPKLTTDGFEVHFGINYLGHAFLSRLLIPTLLFTAEQDVAADVRVVCLSSDGHISAPPGGVDFEAVKTDCSEMSWFRRYGQSKVATIGLAKELARNYEKIKAVAIHPGRVSTSISSTLEKNYGLLFALVRPLQQCLAVPVQVGINNHLWAATSPDVVSGLYYNPVGIPEGVSAQANDDELARRLGEWTDDVLKSAKSLGS